MRVIPIAAVALALAACSTPAGQRIVVEGQLFCAIAAQSGPLVAAIVDVAGKPVTVTDKASAVVAALCALAKGIPVVPPANPAGAPVVAVAAPAAVR